MNIPMPIQPQAKVDLKLGIKSSLPDVKATIALFILFWEGTGRLQELVYARQQEGSLIIKDDILTKLVDFTHSVRQGASISEEKFKNTINNNQLLKSQMEAIIVAFELIWKLGKISFQDNRAASAERTGGIRYPKKIAFSANMDIIHYAVCVGNKEKFVKTMLAWLNFDISPDKQIEESLIRILSVFAEDAIFRLEISGQEDLIFNQLGIYQAGLLSNENVNISGDREAKGALRILKNYLKESLNPFLVSANASEVCISTDLKGELKAYADRVSTLAALNAKDTVTPGLDENAPDSPTDASEQTTDDIIQNLDRIYFGAPGTGKSYQLKEDAKQNFSEDNIERVTFYPNYSYAQFVGTYKPITNGKDISYAYVPGPFMRQWIRAMQNPRIPVLLIVEELNRANAPAVFGDMFQLLDRKDGVSEYSVTSSEDLRKYLESILSSEMKASEGKAAWEWLPQDTEIRSIELPENLFIWTTMNSADQGVFPLDTAFKRRWDNIYIGINEKQSVIEKCNFHFADGFYNWNEFRKEINSLLTSCRVNEDKLIGPFFLNPLGLSDEQFADKFKSKVLMYLYEDAARQCRGSVFAEDDNKKQRTYSDLCAAFDKTGAGIFKGIKLTIVSPEEDASLNVEQKTDLQNFVEYLKEKKNLGENSRRGYGSWVGAVLKLLKEKNIPLDTAIKDNAIVFSAISDTYPNEGTRTNYYTGWRSFVEFKNNDSTGTQE